MVRIEITTGPEAGRQVDLAAGTHVIGRQADCDLQLSVTSVSGRHLEVRVGADGSVHFQDLGSTNGTHSSGRQVQDGEWFPGSELKLGTAGLRLLDPNQASPAAAPDEDSAMHARARQQAMAGGRRGGPMMLLALVLVVGGAAGGYWYLTRSDAETVATSGGGEGPAVARVNLDWIDNLGDFAAEDAAAAWQVGTGLVIQEGALVCSQASRRAQLARRFTLPGPLSLSAEVRGGAAVLPLVVPLVEWGDDQQEQAIATWMAGDLSQGQVDLALPAEATWFRLSLLLGEGAEVRQLSVTEGTGVVTPAQSDGRPLLSGGGNLLLRHHDGRALVHARAAGGRWQEGAAGLEYDPQGAPRTLTMVLGDAAADAGPMLILGDGGPVEAAPGVVVEGSPGLLLGGGARRFLMRFPAPVKVIARDRQISFEVTQPLLLRWDLSDEINRAARLARQLESASADADAALVLAISAEILRDLPFDEEKTTAALRLARDTIQSARERLRAMTEEKEDARLLEAVGDLAQLEQEARAMAERMAATELHDQALAMADELKEIAELFMDRTQRETAAYRQRLGQALAGAYPLLAAWLDDQGAQLVALEGQH